MTSISILVLIIAMSLVNATGLDPINNYCNRWFHQSQVKNGVLFIDGGIETFSNRSPIPNNPHNDTYNYTGPVIAGPNQYIVAVNMSSSWDWKTNITEMTLNKTLSLGSSNNVPVVQSGVLFHGGQNDSQIYLFGGVTSNVNTSFPGFQTPTSSQYILWGFNTDTYGWTEYDVLMNVSNRPSWGAYTELPEHGLAFYLNGAITNMSSYKDYFSHTEAQTLQGMVVIDLFNQKAKNISTDILNDGDPVIRGGMSSIARFGSMGILISFGGATGLDPDMRLTSMSQINVFDVQSAFQSIPASSKNGWYTQTINGIAPEPRVDFCIGVVTAPDESSFNIYMYGGWNPTTNRYYDEVWVLSIPSFQWIRVFEGTAKRFGHTCHIVGNRQMITVGGIESSNITAPCDWEAMGVAILDLTLMTWGSIFDSNAAPYQVNTMISDVIGGGPDGNATKLLPEGGWTSTGLANLFTGTSNQTEPYSPAGSSSVNTGSDNAHASTIRATVGGVVGGVVVLALIVVLGWAIITKRLRLPGGTKKTTGSVETRFDKPELQSNPVTSVARPEVASEAPRITPAVSGTTVGELSGRVLTCDQLKDEATERNDDQRSRWRGRR